MRPRGGAAGACAGESPSGLESCVEKEVTRSRTSASWSDASPSSHLPKLLTHPTLLQTPITICNSSSSNAMTRTKRGGFRGGAGGAFKKGGTNKRAPAAASDDEGSPPASKKPKSGNDKKAAPIVTELLQDDVGDSYIKVSLPCPFSTSLRA